MVSHVGGNAVAAQESCVIEYNTQASDDTTRDLSGTAHVNFLPFKFSVKCKWPPQTRAARATLLTAIYNQANLARFPITFMNPFTGDWDSSHYFYIGTPATQEVMKGRSDYWDGFEVHFIEV